MHARKPRSAGLSPVFLIGLVLAVATYVLLLVMFDRSLFSPRPGRVQEEPDGFEMTIVALLSGDDETPLWLLARYAVIWPMLWLDEFSTRSILQGLYLMVYSLPVVLWKPEGSRRNVLQLVLLLIPVFVSFRLAISIYAMVYCLIFLVDCRVSAWNFLWYSFPVFLSSSTMFIYLVYFPLLAWPRLKASGWEPKMVLWTLYLVVLDQFLDKALGLFNRSLEGEVLSTAANADLDFSGSTTGFFLTMMTGNPFFTAIVAGQYDRFVLLLPSLGLAAFMVVKLWRSGNARVLGFVLILLASMLSEGVGSYSVGVVLYLMLLHHKRFLSTAANKPQTPSRQVARRPRRPLVSGGAVPPLSQEKT